jgi:hypothetical protein
VARTRDILIPPWIESSVPIFAGMVMVKCPSDKRRSFGATEWGSWCTLAAIRLLHRARHTKLLSSVRYEILRESHLGLAAPVDACLCGVEIYICLKSNNTEIPGTSSLKLNRNDGFQKQQEINPLTDNVIVK